MLVETSIEVERTENENKTEQQRLLGVAISLATHAHDGQYDKSGAPYILHPLKLMSQLMYDLDLATIAVLHDVIEDSPYEIVDLIKLGFSNRVVDAVSLLTHEKKVKYPLYIKAIATNMDAITVKRKDLEHNSDITRLKGIREKDIKRIEKYHRAFIFLGESRDKLKDIELLEKIKIKDFNIYEIYAIGKYGTTEVIDSIVGRIAAKALVATYADLLKKGKWENNTSLEDITEFNFDKLVELKMKVHYKLP